MITFFNLQTKIICFKTCTNFVIMDKFLLDFYPKQMFKQTNFKLSYDSSIKDSITIKTRLFQDTYTHRNQSTHSKAKAEGRFKKELGLAMHKVSNMQS